MEITVEERRLAMEVIAKLVHMKRPMAELILEPAGVPRDIYTPLLYKREEGTGRIMSKRQIAPLILDALENRGDCRDVIRSIIEIAASWNKFHLAHDEYEARAIVQKADEIMGDIGTAEAQESERKERERREVFREKSQLLLMMFDDLAKSTDKQRRGYLLQELLNQLFTLYGIPVVSSFIRNKGSEQIDGAFLLEGWHYIVECRWRNKPSDTREVDGLLAQVGRSGKQTMGLFLSINGWSDNVLHILKQNPAKTILLMDGYDLRTILAEQIDFRDFLLTKIARLNLRAEPYYGVAQYMKERRE